MQRNYYSLEYDDVLAHPDGVAMPQPIFQGRSTEDEKKSLCYFILGRKKSHEIVRRKVKRIIAVGASFFLRKILVCI